MRTTSTLGLSSLLLAPLGALVIGCGAGASYVHSDAALGRVVIYRNGIAYFERRAQVDGDTLRLAVPADKVDDFLKSLTVVDAKTGAPAPVSYPTTVPESHDGLVDMNIGLSSGGAHDLRLSYVTESPSWKPSYRVVLGKDGKLDVQGWAIVDNTSGEDWNDVQLGVGSSSALSFRFDLRSIRNVQRETLRTDGMFALAPPTGGAAYGQQAQRGARVLGDLRAEELDREAPPPAPVTLAEARQHRKGGGKAPAQDPAPRYRTAPNAAPKSEISTGYGGVAGGTVGGLHGRGANVDELARAIGNTRSQIVVEGFADAKDGDKNAASLERANKARERLIKNGVAADRVVAIGRGEQQGRDAGVRVVEAPAETPKEQLAAAAATATSEPIGSSHFESSARMSVRRGTSAMVSILSTSTKGEVVYLYDPESARGNATFPFKSVRIQNPTDSVLESGPVTVFGEGKFVGEGLAEPIPARSMAFVPFALDRQVVVERKEDERDRIARILSVQRGVFSTEVQHTRRTTLTLNNRLGEKATVYVRHTPAAGFAITSPKVSERLGAAYLFPVTLAAHEKVELEIEEASPLYRTADIRSPAGMELVSVFLSSAAMDGPLKGEVATLLELQKKMGNVEQQIATQREAISEYKARMDELHAQVVTLRAVKSAGPLIGTLEKKLGEISDKLGKKTVDLVAMQEALMVSRIKFQDGVSELTLEKKSGSAGTSRAASRD